MPALLQRAASKNCPWARILSELQEERNLENSGPQVGISNQFHMASKEGSLDESPGSRNYFYLCCFYRCFQRVHS